jgi:glycine/serine hydroxymethyltransferase
MNRIVPVVILLAFGAYWLYAKSPIAPRPTGPDMVTAFSKDASKSGYAARQDAKQFAELCRSLHNTLESDWSHSPSLLQSGAQVDTLRVVSRRLYTAGKSYNDSYPALKRTLEDHFSRHVDSAYGPLESTGGPLNEQAKAGWLTAFRELADASEYAAGKL